MTPSTPDGAAERDWAFDSYCAALTDAEAERVGLFYNEAKRAFAAGRAAERDEIAAEAMRRAHAGPSDDMAFKALRFLADWIRERHPSTAPRTRGETPEQRTSNTAQRDAGLSAGEAQASPAVGSREHTSLNPSSTADEEGRDVSVVSTPEHAHRAQPGGMPLSQPGTYPASPPPAQAVRDAVEKGALTWFDDHVRKIVQREIQRDILEAPNHLLRNAHLDPLRSKLSALEAKMSSAEANLRADDGDLEEPEARIKALESRLASKAAGGEEAGRGGINYTEDSMEENITASNAPAQGIHLNPEKCFWMGTRIASLRNCFIDHARTPGAVHIEGFGPAPDPRVARVVEAAKVLRASMRKDGPMPTTRDAIEFEAAVDALASPPSAASETREETPMQDVICSRCGAMFWTKQSRDEHLAAEHAKPAAPPAETSARGEALTAEERAREALKRARVYGLDVRANASEEYIENMREEAVACVVYEIHRAERSAIERCIARLVPLEARLGGSDDACGVAMAVEELRALAAGAGRTSDAS